MTGKTLIIRRPSDAREKSRDKKALHVTASLGCKETKPLPTGDQIPVIAQLGTALETRGDRHKLRYVCTNKIKSTIRRGRKVCREDNEHMETFVILTQ